MFQIEGSLADELDVMIHDALPRETGGLIIDGREAVELTNYADLDSAFAFHLVELRQAVRGIPVEEVSERVVLWHSHPGGGVGPSREDMQNKTPLKYHLVLALVDGNLVPTWY
jgi:proteasome lid subunit RPN8/RPN11